MKNPELARRRAAKQQRGSILVNVAVGLSSLIILLSVFDLGYLFYLRREYQKTADLAAMAGARALPRNPASVVEAATQNAEDNLGGRTPGIDVDCGTWSPTTTPLFTETSSCADADADAVRVVVSGTNRSVLPYIGERTIGATAVARAGSRLAALSVRSTLVSVDTAQSSVLNQLFGGFLGGNVALTAGGWNGLLSTEVQLLDYLDQLALNLGVQAGDYEQLLETNASAGELVDTAIDVLEQGGGTGDVNAAIAGFTSLRAGIPAGAPLLMLGDLIGIQTGTSLSGASGNVQAFQLAQAIVQAANAESGLVANVSLPIPGVGNIDVRSKVLEPPQLSAVGDPELAAVNPMGPNRIYVRTAQVRTLASIDLPIAGSALSTIQALLDNSLVSAIAGAVNSLLTLDLAGLVSQLTCALACDIQKDVVDIRVLPNPRVDINLDAGSGEAHVEDYACGGDKMLEVPARTAAATLRIGKLGDSAADAATKVFSSSSAPTVDAVPLLDIGTYRARHQCTLLLICSTTWRTATGTWTSNKSLAQRTAFAGGGIGIRADVPVAGTSETEIYTQPPTDGLPNMNQSPAWHSLSSTNVVSSLSSSLGGLQLEFFPASGTGSGLGNVLSLVGSVANSLVSALGDVIDTALSPLLDPLINFLATSLGADLNQVDIGANLSCGSEPVLVE